MKQVKCNDSRPCFAKTSKGCSILRETYKDGECPFCKPHADYTRGVRHEYDHNYEGRL